MSGAKVKYRANATSGTWFARDNTAAFLKWCNQQRVKQECMFETEGLGKDVVYLFEGVQNGRPKLNVRVHTLIARSGILVRPGVVAGDSG